MQFNLPFSLFPQRAFCHSPGNLSSIVYQIATQLPVQPDIALLEAKHRSQTESDVQSRSNPDQGGAQHANLPNPSASLWHLPLRLSLQPKYTLLL